MKLPTLLPLTLSSLFSMQASVAQSSWLVESEEDWTKAQASQEGLVMEKGSIAPSEKSGTFQSVMKRFSEKQSASAITLKQSPIWQNWNPIMNLGPSNLQDAPVLLSKGADDYWMFGRYGSAKKKGQKQDEFVAEDVTLEGFDVALKSTPFKNQYDAPGGLKKGKGGYHAWQSKDMVNWVHHGPVSEKFSRWVTTAEYADGKTYIYYDYPNDQDPHVYVDSDLTDGIPGENKGMAFKDPSDGSDCAVIRDLDGKFHVIYEDWSPIDANKRSWDSPLAGRATSENGISGFKLQKPVVDNRTTPTGKKATYKHPHWLQHPDWDSNIAEYEIHEPEQEAYGDWASISIGGQYYLFGDFDPAGGHKMSVGWFTTSDLNEQFEWCDNIGDGHPDPDICFAEGQFYLATQQKVDFTSPGPWVDGVEVRVGVDTDNDGKSDQWSEWAQVKESYDYIEGFSKQVKMTPAALDLTSLPEGYGFQFEVKLTDPTENKSKPILESVELSF